MFGFIDSDLEKQFINSGMEATGKKMSVNENGVSV